MCLAPDRHRLWEPRYLISRVKSEFHLTFLCCPTFLKPAFVCMLSTSQLLSNLHIHRLHSLLRSDDLTQIKCQIPFAGLHVVVGYLTSTTSPHVNPSTLSLNSCIQLEDLLEENIYNTLLDSGASCMLFKSEAACEVSAGKLGI
jgi:hypothetical protein